MPESYCFSHPLCNLFQVFSILFGSYISEPCLFNPGLGVKVKLVLVQLTENSSHVSCYTQFCIHVLTSLKGFHKVERFS